MPHQLKRLAKRAALGVGKMGGIAANSSGEIFIAFSTANPGAANRNFFSASSSSNGDSSGDPTKTVVMLPNKGALNPLFQATIWAVEEAIVNAMLAAETMTGGG